MSTIKFDNLERIDELIARIYLDTKHKLSKKELLNIIFELGIRDYPLLLRKIKEPKVKKCSRQEFIEKFSGALTLDHDCEIEPKLIWEREITD
jgi:hypothetical protein